jgi:putative chitinase
MQITKEQFKRLAPRCKDSYAESMAECLPEILEKYEINSPLRFAHFIAQAGHECAGFTIFSENLNYKAEALTKVFPKYFKDVDPNAYARQPEKIANRVYGSRMGNGDEASGDGWRFRGRGAIQLTGKNNYTAFANDNGITIDEAVEYLGTDRGTIESAAWFWHKNGLNALADKDDVVAVTKRVNGGTIGLEDRTKHLHEAKEICSEIF